MSPADDSLANIADERLRNRTGRPWSLNAFRPSLAVS